MRDRLVKLVICTCVVAAAAACGKSNNSCSSSPTSPGCGQPLTTQQINDISASVGPALSLAFSQMEVALSNVSFAVRARRSQPLAHLQSTTVPFTGSAPCDGGGSVGVSGSFVDSTNANGSGPATMNMSLSMSSCTENGIVLQGNPNLTFGGTFNYYNFDIVNPASFTIGGGFFFTLDGTKGSAAYDCSASIDVNTFAVSETGHVTLQYPNGQNSTSLACSDF